jgi:hypothetical protein
MNVVAKVETHRFSSMAFYDLCVMPLPLIQSLQIRQKCSLACADSH